MECDFYGSVYCFCQLSNDYLERPDGLEVSADWIKPGTSTQREKCISILLNQGVNPNEVDFHNFTPLHYATMYGWIDTVK